MRQARLVSGVTPMYVLPKVVCAYRARLVLAQGTQWRARRSETQP